MNTKFLIQCKKNKFISAHKMEKLCAICRSKTFYMPFLNCRYSVNNNKHKNLPTKKGELVGQSAMFISLIRLLGSESFFMRWNIQALLLISVSAFERDEIVGIFSGDQPKKSNAPQRKLSPLTKN